MKKLIFTVFLLTTIFSCDSDDTDNFNPKFKFTFNWNGEAVNLSDFNEVKYTNENGEQLSITRMRYLISRMQLNSNTSVNDLEGYNLADLTNQVGLSFQTPTVISSGNYSSISFTVGFNEEDNALEYPDLNATNWNWPDMLGSGYHIMQYEGKFINVNNEEQFYAMHLGTRRVSEGVFEPNHYTVTLNFDDNTVLNNDSEIEIQMNIAEWFKNPNTWDLNVLNAPLMPNYNAQVMMQANGSSVFSVQVN